MKLSDKKFTATRQTVHNDRLNELDKRNVRLALNPDLAAEEIFDILAQAGGSNMIQQPPTEDPASEVPMAGQDDIVDVTEDIWPEPDIIRQVQDLKAQGLQYGPALQNLIQMGVLGSGRPMQNEVDYLDSLIKKVYKTAQVTKTRPSELAPGEFMVFNDGKSTYHKIEAEDAGAGGLTLTHRQSDNPEVFPEQGVAPPKAPSPIPEKKPDPQLDHDPKEPLGDVDWQGPRLHRTLESPKGPVVKDTTKEKSEFKPSGAEEITPQSADMITRKMMLVKSFVGGKITNWEDKQKPKKPKSVDQKVIDSKTVHYQDTNPEKPKVKDMLKHITTESGKRAEILNFLETVKKVHAEYATISNLLSRATHNRENGLSPKKQKALLDELKDVKRTPGSKAGDVLDQRNKILENYEFPNKQRSLEKLEKLKEEWLMSSMAARENVLERMNDEYAKINKQIPFFSPGKNAIMTEKRNLQRSMSALQGKVSYLGSLYKQILNAFGMDSIPKNPDTEWLNEALREESMEGTGLPEGLQPETSVVPDWYPKRRTPDEEEKGTAPPSEREKTVDEENAGDVRQRKNPRASREAQMTVDAFGSGVGADHFEIGVTHESGQPAAAAELSGLLKSLGASGIVEQVSDGVFRVDLPEELEHKLIVDGHFKVTLDKFVLESLDTNPKSAPSDEANKATPPAPGPKSSAGTGPAGTAANPIDGQRDTLSSPEIQGTGKMGQAMPPAPPGGAPPPADPGAPPADDMGIGELGDMGMPEMDDDRSMPELIEEIKKDMDALSSKIEGGDTMMDDKELEPIKTDSGSIPQPGPQKVAVDSDAKEYYHDLYGQYGDDMTRDRLAEIESTIDITATQHGVRLSDARLFKLVSFMMDDVSGDSFYNDVMKASSANEELARVSDTILVNFILKTGVNINALDSNVKPSIFAMALNDSKMFGKVSAIIAQKMKTPKPAKSQGDAVKVDAIGDNAEDGVPTPGHVNMHVDDAHVKGKYVHMDISWDPDEAEGHASGGVKQLVNSFIKGLESKKEFVDLGVLGTVNFAEFDPEGGFAAVYFMSSKPSNVVRLMRTE